VRLQGVEGANVELSFFSTAVSLVSAIFPPSRQRIDAPLQLKTIGPVGFPQGLPLYEEVFQVRFPKARCFSQEGYPRPTTVGAVVCR